MTTPWLEPDLKATWRLWISATRLVEDALDRQLREDSEMPLSYYEILVRLSAQPTRSMRMSELAGETLSSRSRLSHAVGRLESLGWVRREADPDDRRGQSAVLTDGGMAALEAAAPGHVREVRTRLFDPLDAEEIAGIDSACRAILEALGRDPDAIAAQTD